MLKIFFSKLVSRGGSSVNFGRTEFERKKRERETIAMQFKCYSVLARLHLKMGDPDKSKRRLNNAIR